VKISLRSTILVFVKICGSAGLCMGWSARLVRPHSRQRDSAAIGSAWVWPIGHFRPDFTSTYHSPIGTVMQLQPRGQAILSASAWLTVRRADRIGPVKETVKACQSNRSGRSVS
jgi:hypothetical protein